eukprot:3941474-Rhodomonas_salina.2
MSTCTQHGRRQRDMPARIRRRMKSTCVRGMIPSGQEGREAEGSAALRLGAASAMVRFPKGRGLVCGGDGTRAGFREEDKVELHEAEGNVQTDLPARLTALVVSGERLGGRFVNIE